MEEVLQQLKEFRDSIVLPERDDSPRDLFDDSPDPNEAHTYLYILDAIIRALEKIQGYEPNDPTLKDLIRVSFEELTKRPLTEENWIDVVKRWNEPTNAVRNLAIIVNHTL